MAFQAIVNGSDCGPSNPLQSLLNHFQSDSQSNQLHHQYSKQSTSSSKEEQQTNSNETQAFLNPQPQITSTLFHQSSLHHHPSPISISHQDSYQTFLPHHLNSNSNLNSIRSEDESNQINTFLQHHPNTLNQTNHHQDLSNQWTHEFSTQPNPIQEGLNSNPIQAFGLHSNRFMNTRFNQLNQLGGGGGEEGIMRGILPEFMGSQSMIFNQSNHHLNSSNPLQQHSKFIELSDENWELEFSKVGDLTDPSLNSNESFTSKSNQTETQEELHHHPSESESDQADLEFMKALETTWKNLNLNTSLNESELHQLEDRFGAYDSLDHHSSTSSIFNQESIDEFLKDSKPFPFQADLTKYSNLKDPFEEGQRLISIGAPLSEAALAFEAACQSDPNRGEVWRVLGETYAADEKEHLAIKAFEKAIGCGGIDGQSSWISLAISWVNEGYEMRSLATLERWLEITYPTVVQQAKGSKLDQLRQNPWDRHSKVVEMFLSAARAGPKLREGEGKESIRSQLVDGEVQVGLGVLFYSNNEFKRAQDCFESALEMKPNDFLLWNRLGATLANGGEAEEAIEAYRKALEIRPTFTRAIYNLGVSCMNINCFKEGAEHLLAAISLHQRSKNRLMMEKEEKMKGMGLGFERDLVEEGSLLEGDGSQNLYRTLQRALICLDRQDLADQVKLNVDVEIFKREGFEF
ncbi:hypothetical protein DFH28DRAFT_1047793 [Melampsora americana]|nr:hypothetical protein DFH28DRAFT_1047793 [Melampsora americana]